MKNTQLAYGFGGIVIGLVIGILVFWSIQGKTNNGVMTHQMPDGTMMSSMMPMDMASMMASMNNELAGKTGTAFDKAFISEMIVHHQGAVQMAELALTNAERQEIKDLAKNIIAAQNKEISDMQTWQQEWYGR